MYFGTFENWLKDIKEPKNTKEVSFLKKFKLEIMRVIFRYKYVSVQATNRLLIICNITGNQFKLNWLSCCIN